MVNILLLAMLLVSSASALDVANPGVAKTINAPPAPSPPPPPLPPVPDSPGFATDLDCTTYETASCSGGSALHAGMVLGANIANNNMNSIRCNRDLRAHEQIDLSTHPKKKRDVENGNASEPIDLSMLPQQKRDGGDDSCNLYIGSLHGGSNHGPLSGCIAFSRAANCLNLRRDDKK